MTNFLEVIKIEYEHEYEFAILFNFVETLGEKIIQCHELENR